MLYIPGDEVRYAFSVPDGAGDHISGLTWSVVAIVKDNQRLVAGTEYSSFSIADHVSNAYALAVFTPLSSSSATFAIMAKSDAVVPDYFELHLEPDWAKITMLAEKIEHVLGNPETVTYYMPDGSTVIREFNMTRVGTLETREGA